mmetsp:Transcript_14002/g.34181  ORF Transcript_14002/g.34181 Transcript_14002/m.34181 type:complete len:91 (-) Transcript_14002:1853-2125(-)
MTAFEPLDVTVLNLRIGSKMLNRIHLHQPKENNAKRINSADAQEHTRVTVIQQMQTKPRKSQRCLHARVELENLAMKKKKLKQRLKKRRK